MRGGLGWVGLEEEESLGRLGLCCCWFIIVGVVAVRAAVRVKGERKKVRCDCHVWVDFWWVVGEGYEDRGK